MGLQYTGTVTHDACGGKTSVQDALRRQIEDPEDHDVSLIEECLSLTPDERLQRLTSWVAFVASTCPSSPQARAASRISVSTPSRYL